MMKCLITTTDNPFCPFEQFDSWYRFDTEKGYNTSCYLARVAQTSDRFTEAENDREMERAIDEIIKYDFKNIYKKVKKNVEDD